ncbi:MAG: alpha/beta fold hydrolase [Propionibacteriales bacterium]|nr:alpha/beta fold hydrolase [Propionibacteriales bacterium]
MDPRVTTTVNGAPLEYVDKGGAGPVIVLLHGALMDEYLWRDVVTQIAPEHRCVIPVLPMGAHRLPMPGLDVSPAAQAELVADLLVDLELDDVTLVGNDTGGAIAQLLAAHRPESVGRLVLVSCDAFENFPPGLPGKLMALLCKMPGAMYLSMLSLRIPPLRRLPATFGWMAKRPIPNDIFTRWLDAYLSNRRVRADVRRMMSHVDSDDLLAAAPSLRAFTGPALIVWATEDRVMPVDHATRLAEHLPNARVSLVEDSYTLMPLDQPQPLAGLIAAHIREAETAVTGTHPRPPATTQVGGDNNRHRSSMPDLRKEPT